VALALVVLSVAQKYHTLYCAEISRQFIVISFIFCWFSLSHKIMLNNLRAQHKKHISLEMHKTAGRGARLHVKSIGHNLRGGALPIAKGYPRSCRMAIAGGCFHSD